MSSELNETVVKNILIHLFDTKTESIEYKKFISPSVKMEVPFLSPSLLEATDQSSQEVILPRNSFLEKMAIINLPSIVLNKFYFIGLNVGVKEGSIQEFLKKENFGTSEWTGLIIYTSQLSLSSFTIYQVSYEIPVRLFFQSIPIQPESKGGKKELNYKQVSVEGNKTTPTEDDEKLLELEKQETVRGKELIRIDFNNTEFAAHSSNYYKRTLSKFLKYAFSLLLPYLYLVLSYFNLAISSDITRSIAKPPRHHVHRRKLERSSTSSSKSSSSCSTFVPRPIRLTGSVDLGRAIVPIKTKSEPSGLSGLAESHLSSLLAEVNQGITMAGLALKLIFDEAQGIFYALQSGIQFGLLCILSILGVAVDLVEDGLRGAVEEGEKYGREEALIEREFEREKERRDRSPIISRLSSRSNLRVNVTGATKSSVRSSTNPPVLTKRVSFSFPDDEPRPVIIGAEDDSRPSLIGYPSPPSSNEDALETNDNFLSENFLPSEGSQLDGGLQIDTEDDSIIDTEINQFDAAPFQLSPEISEIDPSTASPQDGFNFLYPVDEYSSPLLAQRRFATTELAAGEETRFDGSSFPEGNGHDTRAFIGWLFSQRSQHSSSTFPAPLESRSPLYTFSPRSSVRASTAEEFKKERFSDGSDNFDSPFANLETGSSEMTRNFTDSTIADSTTTSSQSSPLTTFGKFSTIPTSPTRANALQKKAEESSPSAYLDIEKVGKGKGEKEISPSAGSGNPSPKKPPRNKRQNKKKN